METTNVLLQSNNITLVSDYGVGGCHHNELWQLCRRTAVEPGQASSPDFASFSDECLFCAYIMVNPTAPACTEGQREINQSSWDTDPLEEHTQRSPPAASPLPPPNPLGQRAGLIYLYAGPANLPAGEANIAVVLKEDKRCCGYAREAVQLVLRWAFEDLKFHRIQAAILDMPFKDRALRLFIGSGFAHEGTRRRAVYQPEGDGIAGVWKDVTYLAMLDTEWMLRSTWKQDRQPVITVWDEMFARHSREREELLRWEENHGRVKRSSSTETLRENARNAVQDMAYLTDDAASVSEASFSDSLPPSPRLNVVVTQEEDADMADAFDTDEFGQRWEEVIERTLAERRQRQGMGGSLLGPSPRGHLLTLPSIPSTRISEGNPQSPLTIRTPSTPGSTPPPSPSVLPSIYDSWPDSEDEDSRLLRETPLANIPTQLPMPHDSYPPSRPARLRSRPRSRSSSSSSTDSWSDAQSSVSASSSNWDVISNTSARSHRGRI